MSEQIRIMKQLLHMDLLDEYQEELLVHFIKKATSSILGYCNIDTLPLGYDDVVTDYAVYLYRNRDSDGLTQKREGERTVTYQSGIPDNIRLSLPLPRIKVGY